MKASLMRNESDLWSFPWPPVLLLIVICSLGSAQDAPLEPPPLPVNPTPLDELLTDPEQGMVRSAKNANKLVDTYLKISDFRLDAALNGAKKRSFVASEADLDVYNKSIVEAGKIAFGDSKNKRRLTKRIEQRLYKQIKTLEMLGKLFPADRAPFAEAALEGAKLLRIKSLNATFASGQILDEPDKEIKPKDEPNEDGPARDEPAEPPPSLVPVAFHRSAQIPGDYLTEEEDDKVRSAQEADERAKVFMKIADRRLAAATGVSPDLFNKKAMQKSEEELRDWGAVPQVERSELLRHYARAIAELIEKLEDAYERNPKSSALPKALVVLRDSTDRHLPILRSLSPQLAAESEIDALREAVQQAEAANQGAREGLKSK